MKASIIIPIVRPEIAKVCIEAIEMNAGIPRDEYEIVAIEDKERIGCPRMVDLMVKFTKSDNVVFLGEDTVPQKDFLLEALKAMEQLPDGWGLVALNDGMLMKPGKIRKCKLACHWMANKKLLPLLGGQFFYDGYIHTGCDNELTIRCYDLGKYIFAEKSIIKHRKIDDEFHKDVFSKSNQEYGMRLLEYRHKNKWCQDINFTGERCVPRHMAGNTKIYQCHLSRYNFSLMYTRGKKVLDAACGSGFGTNLLFDVTKGITGVDIDVGSIDYARHNYRGDFQLMDLDRSFPKDNYDIVVSFETIEHLTNPDIFLGNVVQHTKEFLFSVPLNLPSHYHVQVYKDIDDVKTRIGKFFKEVTWFSQGGLNISSHIKDSRFLIGHAKV